VESVLSLEQEISTGVRRVDTERVDYEQILLSENIVSNLTSVASGMHARCFLAHRVGVSQSRDPSTSEFDRWRLVGKCRFASWVFAGRETYMTTGCRGLDKITPK